MKNIIVALIALFAFSGVAMADHHMGAKNDATTTHKKKKKGKKGKKAPADAAAPAADAGAPAGGAPAGDAPKSQ